MLYLGYVNKGKSRRYSRNLEATFEACRTLSQIQSPIAELVKAAAPSDDAASLRLRIKEEVRVNVEKRKSQQSMGGGKNGIQLQGGLSDSWSKDLIQGVLFYLFVGFVVA